MLSEAARALWAKTSRTDYSQWLPLFVHMADAAGMAQRLWKHWLPRGVRERIAAGLGIPIHEAACVATALVAMHDVGKATPAFQQRAGHLAGLVTDCGLPLHCVSKPGFIPHAQASQAILEEFGIDSSLAIVAGGHHGRPPNFYDVDKVKKSYPKHTGFDDAAWRAVQEELGRYAGELGGVEISKLTGRTADVPAQVLLSAFTIMADWLASDETLFPYYDINDAFLMDDLDARAARAWDMLALPASWDTACEFLDSAAFLRRFGVEFIPRPLQEAVLKLAPNIERPGIMVIEAPMGEGKTEAALAAAEIFAGKTKRSGVFFALPTQATSDGLFPRFKAWISRLEQGEFNEARDLLLAHGKSRFNEEYTGIPLRRVSVCDDADDESGVVAHEWFHGRRKSMLAGFVVGTIDQVLLAGLRQKHQALRHLGLANKVVVIDECHAYDAYMGQYLTKVLEWLGAYGVPVIVLSATLPGDKRRKIVRAYLHKKKAEEIVDEPSYPRITYSDGKDVHAASVMPSPRKLSVAVEMLPDGMLGERVDALVRGGGCVGVIVNTVTRAQALRREFAARLGEDAVKLFHSRFLASERAAKEKELRALLGRPGASDGPMRPERLVVVGTQVMEQSLDVDFDVLLTDLCPMDLLIQRIGRLHRHERPRPPGLETARCFVLGSSDGETFDRSSKVYGEWPLLTARTMLSGRSILNLPGDIAALVEEAYASDGVSPPEGEEARFDAARMARDTHIRSQRARAKHFQVPPLSGMFRDLTGWLAAPKEDDGDADGKRAEAAVRDTDPSLEALVIERRPDGTLGLLPWIGNGEPLPAGGLKEPLAALVAGCSLALPRSLSAPWKIEQTIKKLEADNLHDIPAAWQSSPWLRGELVLAMQREGDVWVARIGGYRLEYDRENGLAATREDGE